MRISRVIFLFSILFCFTRCGDSSENISSKQTSPLEVKYKSTDGLLATANLYLNKNKSGPIIILCHQAGWNKSEYNEIAPRLVQLGYTCLAIDQRSGGKINGEENETHIRAKKQGFPISYKTAGKDIKGAIQYMTLAYPKAPIILWGSSYSASLALTIGCNNKNVDAIIAFSPGEYFKNAPHYVKKYLKGCTKPVFFSSKKSEVKQVKKFYQLVKNDIKTQYIPTTEFVHGSPELYKKTKGHKECWGALKKFLNKLGYEIES